MSISVIAATHGVDSYSAPRDAQTTVVPEDSGVINVGDEVSCGAGKGVVDNTIIRNQYTTSFDTVRFRITVPASAADGITVRPFEGSGGPFAASVSLQPGHSTTFAYDGQLGPGDELRLNVRPSPGSSAMNTTDTLEVRVLSALAGPDKFALDTQTVDVRCPVGNGKGKSHGAPTNKPRDVHQHPINSLSVRTVESYGGPV